MPDPVLERGWVAPELADGFPELGLSYVTIAARSGRTPEPVRRRMRELASRITGGHVVHMRQDRVPWAYRVFWRQVGIDPDTDRTPVEQIALERLKWGGLRTRDFVDDAITIATLETAVPVLAFDAGLVGSHIGLRLARDHEPLGGSGPALAAEQIVVADEHRALALLSGQVADERRVTRVTERVTIAALQVKGVPAISVEEALWTVADTLSSEG